MSRKIKLRQYIIYVLIISAFLFFISILKIIIEPYSPTFQKDIPRDLEINPTLLNGLLTASSVLFGFSTTVFYQFISSTQLEHKIERLFPSVFLLIQFWALGLGGSAIWYVAVKKISSVKAIIDIYICFRANLISSGFLLGWYITDVYLSKES